jgi:predicted HicB family RNase H-like nuclease
MMYYAMYYTMCLGEDIAKEKSMARYSLNLPMQLKQEAEKWAANQGVSLNQFIV